MRGWQDTAPLVALRWFARAKFVHEHPAYKYPDYDAADAGDILMDAEYHALLAPLTEDADDG